MSRIYESCVASNTLKKAVGADYICADFSIGFGPEFISKKGELGYIDFHHMYLGDDVIINKIVIRGNEALSKELTEKYQHKILIFDSEDLV